jgi:hypothetical protein
MRLCTSCGTIDGHSPKCPQAELELASPREERVRRAMADAEAVLASIKGSKDQKATVLEVLAAESRLERNPSRDLAAYDAKRAHNDLVKKLEKARVDLQVSIPDGEGQQVVEDYPFAKRAVEALWNLSLRRAESAGLEATALSKLPTYPVAAAAVRGMLPRKLCDGIEQRLDETRKLDAQVQAWGWKNLRPMIFGGEPVEVPAQFLGGMAGYLGAIVGRGRVEKKKEATAQFKLLGRQFRERLYLIGSNTILLGVVSRLAQAEEAWKKLLAQDGAARWERIKQEGSHVFRAILGEQEGLPGAVEEVVTTMVTGSGRAVLRVLRPFAEIGAVDWEAYSKAYFYELEQVLSESRTGEERISTEYLTRALIERRKGVEPDRAAIGKRVDVVLRAWEARPPKEAGET